MTTMTEDAVNEAVDHALDKSIVNRAMLVTLNISMWTAAKHDKEISVEVANTHNSDVSMGNFNKKLLDSPQLAKLRKIAGKARVVLYYYTLPWSNSGPRILSSELFPDLRTKMLNVQDEWNKAVQEYLDAYPRLILEAEEKLGDLFKPEEYPTLEVMKKKFNFSMSINPLPLAEDFRVNLGDDDIAFIRGQIEAEHSQLLKGAMGDVFTKLHDHISHLKERLEKYSVADAAEIEPGYSLSGKPRNKRVSNPFRDSLVNKLEDMINIIPSLNITNDPELAKFAQSAKRDLLTFTAEDLRGSAVVRQEVKNKAEAILQQMADKMSDYI